MDRCDIIIPVWNELESTRDCINKLEKHTKYPYRIIIIDNFSDKPTKEYLESLKGVHQELLLIKNSANLGFVKAVNQGIMASAAPYICILNNDAFVTDGWLTSLIETVEHGPKNIGMANPASNVFGKNSAYGKRYEWQELDSCRGFCMLIKREVVERIGIFDEIYGIGYFEEKDFSRRAIDAGYICIMAKNSFAFHRDRLTFDKIKERDEIFRRNEAIYIKRWGRPLSIAVVVRKGNCIQSGKNLIYRLLDKGHRINMFFPRNNTCEGLKDHIEIRYFPVFATLFDYAVLYKLLERRRKKKVDLVVSDDRDSIKFFNRFKFAHGAAVISGAEDDIVRFCETKSKEG